MDSHSQRLGDVLLEQIRAAEAMLETLGRESEALAGGNLEALSAATGAKAQLVGLLEKLEAERRELAEREEKADETNWPRLRELIARCKEQNLRNGALLNARAENVRTALKTLRGSEPELYGSSGRTPTRADARNLGTA